MKNVKMKTLGTKLNFFENFKIKLKLLQHKGLEHEKDEAL
jgi:hypothetical protein